MSITRITSLLLLLASACVATVHAQSSAFLQDAASPHLVVIEAENYSSTATNGSSDAWTETTVYPGHTGSAAMIAGPDDGSNWNSNVPASAPVLNFTVQFEQSGTHYLWVRLRDIDAANAGDSLHAGINNVLPASATLIEQQIDGFGINESFVWAAKIRDGSRVSVEVPSAGVHTVNLWPREDGIIVDRILLTTDVNYIPTGSESESATDIVAVPDPVDYFTQRFATGQLESAFDLENKTLTLTPNGSTSYYAGGITDATEFPESTSGAQTVSLPDDYFVEVAQPATFYGTTYPSFFINSNGNLSFDFGTNSYRSTLSPSNSADYHFRRIRISAYFRDLNPSAGGTVSWQRMTTAGEERTIVTFDNVANYSPTSNRVNFQIVMWDSGLLTMTWLSCQGSNAVVGLSREARTTLPPDFTETNLSELVGASAPEFDSNPVSEGEAGFAYSYDVRASDQQNDAITLTAPTLPAWLTFTTGANGEATLSGTPPSAGSYPVQLEASDGTDRSFQDFMIEVLAPAPPSISTHPQSQTVEYGSQAQFSVAAASIRPITGYQWRKNGINLSDGGKVSGATTATLSLSGVTDADEAVYSVVAINANGSSAPSDGASLTVNPPPPPSYQAQPQDAWVSHGTTAQFSVTVAGYPPITYQWQRDTGSGWQNLSDGGDISGATTATLSIANAEAADEASFRVLASNIAASDVASDAVTLTVSVAGAPSGPTDLSSGSVFFNLVQLNWTDNSGDETGFRIERAASALGPWSVLTTTVADATSYNDESVVETTAYYYRVFAVNASGDSPPSHVLQVTTPADVPPEISWNFDSGSESWTRGNGSKIQASALYMHDVSPSAMWHSSPRVNLLAGQTYTVSFSARGSGGKNLGFKATSEPGYPANTSGSYNFAVSGSYEPFSHEFTVATDGVYHLTFFSNDLWPNAYIDDVTLSGNFNASPLIEWTYPTANVRTLVGATLPLAATSSDADGGVTRVDFIDENGDLIAAGASDTTAPYAFDWSPTVAGTYTVIARAYDSSNAYADAPAHIITVEPNHLSISTYLGDSATSDNITGMGFLSDGTLVIGGILNADLFTGVTPLYVNGTSSGDRGFVARLSGDGRTVLSVTVVGNRVLDLDIGGSDRIHVAADTDGVVVLESDGTLAFADSFGSLRAHRVDAASGGTFGVLAASLSNYEDNRVSNITGYLYNSSFTQLTTFSGASHNTTDLAVDEATQTVGLIGWRNLFMDDGDGNNFPVDVPAMVGRDFSGVEKYRGYDWGNQNQGDRWLNRLDNNMADTRGARIVLGPDGKFYAGFEMDGGNTPLRYNPFDLAVNEQSKIVGGDNHHTMSNTSTVPKTFVGRYAAATGAFELGQWITARLSSGNDNTTEIVNGNLLVDDFGRIHVTGASSSGMPIGFEPLPSYYQGGAWYLVYSPDFSSREFMTRFTRGNTAAIAVAPDGRYALGGSTDSPLFLTNPMQSTLSTTNDAWFAVGDVDEYFAFQPGPHPRLFFDAAGQAELRLRMNREPYATMLADLIANRNKGDFFRDTTESDPKDVLMRATANAMIFALTGTESYAQDARSDVESALTLIDASNNWANAGIKGLDSYWFATKLAIAYDLCHASAAWDPGFSFQISKRLVDIAPVIINNGGTEQNTDASSNWQAARASSGGLALLATDHSYDSALIDSAEGRLNNFFNMNQGSSTRGWNPEGNGYTAFAIGSYVGPFAIALDRLEPARSVSDLAGMQWMPWTAFAGSVPAPANDPFNVYGLGGIKTDWSDDNAQIGGEGIYGQAFYFCPPELLGGLRHAYDRLQGSLAPDGGKWDAVRHGTFYSLLYYPEDTPAQDPLEIWDWHQANVAPVGLGIMTWRDGFEGLDDILVQFKARSRPVANNSHDGPDGLGFRILGPGAPFVIGGGRNAPGRETNQATVYPGSPDGSLSISESHTGSFVGTPLAKIDGGGHAIASMGTNNVGTSSHKRWIVSDFDKTTTGADAVVIVADTTGNGAYWQLPTFLNNSVNISGNTFTVTGQNGATLKGTVLHPGGTPNITTGTRARGHTYTLLNGGSLATESASNPRVNDNRYLLIEDGGDGDFLVVMTIQKTGSHPTVSRTSGTVADAVIQVGGRSYALQSEDVHYDGSAYVAPDATVTFNAGAHGSITSGSTVQTVAYGGAATAPTVSVDPDQTFSGWNKAFDEVTRSMTVTAVYESTAVLAPELSFGAATYSVNEDGGTVTLQVTRGTSNDGAVSVDYATAGDSALSGVDFTFTSGTLSWADGDGATQTITVPITDDAITEGTESFTVSLSNFTGGAVAGTYATATLTIADDDINLAPSVSVDSPTLGATALVNLTDRLVLETTVTDDHAYTVAWSRQAGPGIASFEDGTAEDTTVTFDTAGDYVLRITVDDGEFTDSADVIVSVAPGADGSGILARWNLQSNLLASDVLTAIETASDLQLTSLVNRGFDGIGYEFEGSGSSFGADYLSVRLTAAGGASIDLNGGSVSMGVDYVNGTGDDAVSGWRCDVISDPDGTPTTLTLDESISREDDVASGTISGFTPATTVEIRIYFKGASWGDWNVANLVVNGSVSSGNLAPETDAGVSAAADAGVVTTLAGSATDDGLPASPGSLSYQWSQLSGPDTAVFANGTSPTSGVTFPVAGTYTLRLTATDGVAKTADDVVYTVSGGSLSPAEQWRQDHFGQTANSGNAADGFDYDADGVVNLLERAFGTLPNNSGSVALPTGQITDDAGTDYLSITYRRLTGGTGTTGIDYTVEGLTYTVEYDSNLIAPWSSGAVSQVGSAVDNSDGTETVTVRLNAAMSGGAYFIRLQVSEAP